MSYLQRLMRLANAARVASRRPAPRIEEVEETVEVAAPRSLAAPRAAAREASPAPPVERPSKEPAPPPEPAPSSTASIAEAAAGAMAGLRRRLHVDFPPSPTNTRGRDEAPTSAAIEPAPPSLAATTSASAGPRTASPIGVGPANESLTPGLASTLAAPRRSAAGVHARTLAEALAAAERWVEAPPSSGPVEAPARRAAPADAAPIERGPEVGADRWPGRGDMSDRHERNRGPARPLAAEADVEVSIGAIHVTVEGPPAAPAAPPSPPPSTPPPTPSPGLGRHYVRGL